MATLARTALERSVGALLSSEVAFCESVIADDDRIDAAYNQIERRAVDIIGRQQPATTLSDWSGRSGCSRCPAISNEQPTTRWTSPSRPGS